MRLPESDPVRLRAIPLLLEKIAGGEVANDVNGAGMGIRVRSWPRLARSRAALAKSAASLQRGELLLARGRALLLGRGESEIVLAGDSPDGLPDGGGELRLE